jgi:hypothetical protein
MYTHGKYASVITFSGYTNAVTLTNFPVLVTFSNNAPLGFLFSKMTSTNGWDLRFTDATNGTLNYEIESWNTNATSYVWVQVPILTNNAYITAYWGGANTNQQPYTTNGATWDSTFRGVWHLNNVASPTDSTTNQNHGTNSGTAVIAGQIGNAGWFDGVNDQIGLGKRTSMQIGNVLTISAWFQTVTNDANYRGIFGSGQVEDTIEGRNLIYNRNGAVVGNIWNHNQATASAGFPVATNVWVHCALSQSGQAGKLYSNGVSIAFTVSQGLEPVTTFYDWYIGRDTWGTARFFNGRIDEARISSVTRSTNWVWAEWLNSASNTTFQTYGAVIAAPIWSICK